MDVEDLVRGHYAGAGIEGTIISALAAAGVVVESLTAEELAPVDQLHAGGVAATLYLLEQLELSPQTRLLDVGCGLGGPSRIAAHTYACSVVGADLSPDFITAAKAFSQRAGLADLVEHQVSSGDRLDFADASFDRAMMIHVGMNVPDKAAVFAEVRRVLRPGSLFGLYEQMRTGDAELTYPMPWAEDARSSFVARPEDYLDQLRAAGFIVELAEDRTQFTGPRIEQGLSPQTVFGDRFMVRVGNNIADTLAGQLAPYVMVARAA